MSRRPDRRGRDVAVIAGTLVALCLALSTAIVAQAEPSARPLDAPAPEASASPAATPASFLASLGEPVQMTTPVSGGGPRPLLDWEPVDGARWYAVYLYAPSGEAYWAWMGANTAVHVGGEPQLRDDTPGPGVAEGMSWSVVAYDESLLPIAEGPSRPIAP